MSPRLVWALLHGQPARHLVGAPAPPGVLRVLPSQLAAGGRCAGPWALSEHPWLRGLRLLLCVALLSEIPNYRNGGLNEASSDPLILLFSLGEN